jgi:hypothetical protein
MRYLIATALLVLSVEAHAGPNTEFFRSLTNEVGQACCDGFDGLRLEDPDWEVTGNGYRVRLHGQWVEVPPHAVVRQPNQVGFAVVWPVTRGTKTEIRCFMPGTMT